MTTEATPAISPIRQIESLYQRLEKARSIAAAGKVHPIIGMTDHYTVESSKGDFYLVNGTCTCIDAQQRIDVHHGWCKHKLAVELFKETPNAETIKAAKPRRRKLNFPTMRNQSKRSTIFIASPAPGRATTHGLSHSSFTVRHCTNRKGDLAMTSKVYEIVTEKIITSLEQGTPPWRKPWQAGIAPNAVTNRPYSGINALLLSMAPYSDPRWLTMKQANTKATVFNVKKVEHLGPRIVDV
jgi:hypothetical protein